MSCSTDLAARTILFASHDLNVVRMMCERTIVLRAGGIVKPCASRTLFANPRTNHTRELVDAVPHIGAAAALVST